MDPELGAVQTLALVGKICRNIVAHPDEPKFRRIKLQSAGFEKV